MYFIRVGIGCSIALDNLGNPWISYSGAADYQLRVAHFTGATWEKRIVDETGDRVTAIAMNKASDPVIAYQDLTNGCLEYAERIDGTWQISTADDLCQAYCVSLVIDSTGNPHIAYIDALDIFSAILKYSFRNGSKWTFGAVPGTNCYAIPPDGYGLGAASIQLDTDGNPCISYYDITSAALVNVRKSGGGWLKEIIDSDGGFQPSLKLRNDGQLSVSYYKIGSAVNSLYYAYCDGGHWYSSLVDSDGSVGAYSSLAFDRSNYSHISYYKEADGEGDLKYAHYDGASWQIEGVDSTDDVGQYSSLALDNSDNPYICYFNDLKVNLKIALCITYSKVSDGYT